MYYEFYKFRIIMINKSDLVLQILNNYKQLSVCEHFFYNC